MDLLLVRDDDIPGLIADGVCDLGVVGRNVLQSRSRIAARAGGLPRSANGGRWGSVAAALHWRFRRPGSGRGRHSCR